MNFDLHQLRAFVTVVETGSFSAAANRLNQTQSAVSQLILNLEQALGQKLIDRSTRPVKSMPAGAECYKFSIKILSQCQQMLSWLRRSDSKRLATLKIGLVDSVVATVGIQLLKCLQPRVERVTQITGTPPELLSALQNGSLDLAVALTYDEIPDGITSYPLLTERFFSVMPSQWPMQTIEQLCQDHSMIAYAQGMPTGKLTQRWLEQHQLRPTIQFELTRSDHVLYLVAAGHGWALTAPMFLANDLSLMPSLNCCPIPALRLPVRLLSFVELESLKTLFPL